MEEEPTDAYECISRQTLTIEGLDEELSDVGYRRRIRKPPRSRSNLMRR